MKKSERCPKCGSTTIGHLENVWDSNADHLVVGTTKDFLIRPAGTLEAYICAECGYYETYVKDPTSVRFGELRGFRWIKAPQENATR
jgi:predicted nucleic-acid-binding Zn-ribbon protein